MVSLGTSKDEKVVWTGDFGTQHMLDKLEKHQQDSHQSQANRQQSWR